MASVRERPGGANAYRVLQVRQTGYETRSFVARTKRDLPQARADADRYRIELERRRALGEAYVAPPESLGAELDGLIDRKRKLGRRASTVARNEQTAKHLAPLRRRLVRELRRPECEDLLAALAGRAPREAQMATALLKQTLRAARDRGQRVDDAIFGIGPPSAVPRDPRFLTLAEVTRLGSWLPPLARRLVLVAALSGMRRGELLALEDGHLELDSGRLWIPRGKTASARRYVDLPADAVGALREQLLARPTGSRLVFPAPSGRRMDADNFMARVFRPAAVSAGLGEQTGAGYRGVSFHDLRHTYASLMIRAGVSAKVIAGQLGHADGGALVLRRYGHLYPDAGARAVSALDSMLRVDKDARRETA